MGADRKRRQAGASVADKQEVPAQQERAEKVAKRQRQAEAAEPVPALEPPQTDGETQQARMEKVATPQREAQAPEPVPIIEPPQTDGKEAQRHEDGSEGGEALGHEGAKPSVSQARVEKAGKPQRQAQEQEPVPAAEPPETAGKEPPQTDGKEAQGQEGGSEGGEAQGQEGAKPRQLANRQRSVPGYICYGARPVTGKKTKDLTTIRHYYKCVNFKMGCKARATFDLDTNTGKWTRKGSPDNHTCDLFSGEPALLPGVKRPELFTSQRYQSQDTPCPGSAKKLEQ